MRKGWAKTTLGEIAEVIGGGTPSTNVSEYWGNDVVWLTPTEIVAIDGKTVSESIRKLSHEGLANSGARILPKGSVILTSRASVGFVAISECELSTNQGFQSLVPGEKVLAYFLMYWIQNNRNEFESRAAGSTFKEISKTNVKSIKLYLPPIPEQKRIVDLISSVDSYIDALEQQAESARKSRSAVLHEMLSAGGEGWVETTLGEVSEVVMGRQLSPDKKKGVRPLPYLRAANIGSWGINLEDILEMDFTKDEEMRFSSKLGDTLLVEGGNEKSVGCPAFVEQSAVGLCIQNTLIRLRSKDINHLDPKFQYHLMRYLYWQGLFAELCAGTTIMHLGQKRAVLIPVNLPPLHEQKRIVDLISSMDDEISATEKLKYEAKQLRSGLLSDLLSGEHEIPEDYDKVMGAA